MEQKTFLNKLFSGKTKYITILSIIVILGLIYILIGKGGNGNQNTAIVTRGTLSQDVLVSGNVKPMKSVELAFEKSGTVSWVNKEVGEKVYAGEIIVSLENGSEQASLENARAQLKSEEARFQELSKGSRPEEISVKEAELQKANQDLNNYYSNLVSLINDAFNKTDNAVNKQTDPIFSNDQTQNPDVTFGVNDQQTKNDALMGRISATEILKKFKILNDSVLSENKTATEKDNALFEAKSYLNKIQTFLVKVSAVLDNATNLSETNLSTYKENIGTARTNVNVALQSISGLIENIASQKIAVEKIKLELNLKKLGSTPEVLAQQESSIMKAEANVKSAESNLGKTVIRSPINGTVTKQDAKRGEIAPANTQLVSVMSDDNFKIEANIPEIDLTKLTIGDKAKITLDAYRNTADFDAEIISIDPAEKIVEGVSTYKTTFKFTNSPKPIRSGMTANIKINTEEKNNVLIIPQKAVFSKNNKKFVTIQNVRGNIEKEIELGIQGSNGMIEILSGLNEGDRVILTN